MSRSFVPVIMFSVCTAAAWSQAFTVSQQEPSASSPNPAMSLPLREAALRRELEALRANNAGEGDANVRQVESDLLEVTGQEDAAMRQLPANSKGSTTSYISMPVYFV